MKKTFDCGHQGKGQYCHRCRGEAIAMADKAEEVNEKFLRKTWLSARIKVSGQIPDNVIGKACGVVSDLERGEWPKCGYKALHRDNSVYSIEVSPRHRMLATKTSTGFENIMLMSHSEYNSFVKRYK